ncbi:MAG: glycosyltransferase family 4 protein, partial [Chloroflexi bacterium]|nr:glycosyltransferase family 4 protein [Chloroflexota bacterium]
MTQPTIAIDFSAALHQGGGIGRYTRELIRALAQYDSASQYKLFGAGVSPIDSLPPLGPNFEWRTTRVSPVWLLRLWHRLRLPLPIESWTGPVDLFHATDFTLPPLRPGTRSILTVHDLS